MFPDMVTKLEVLLREVLHSRPGYRAFIPHFIEWLVVLYFIINLHHVIYYFVLRTLQLKSQLLVFLEFRDLGVSLVVLQIVDCIVGFLSDVNLHFVVHLLSLNFTLIRAIYFLSLCELERPQVIKPRVPNEFL